jgi:hypothetical protein
MKSNIAASDHRPILKRCCFRLDDAMLMARALGRLPVTFIKLLVLL